MTRERLEGILFKDQVVEVVEEEEVNVLMPQGNAPSSMSAGKEATRTAGKKKFKKKEGKNTIQRALSSGAAEYGSQLIEEIIGLSVIDGNTLVKDIPTDGTPSLIFLSRLTIDSVVEKLLGGFKRGYEIVRACESQSVKGYITTVPGKQEGAPAVYDEFMPFRPTGLPPTTTILEYDNVHPFNSPFPFPSLVSDPKPLLRDHRGCNLLGSSISPSTPSSPTPNPKSS